MKLEPFDLERAKAGDPICMRNGEPVRFIAHVPDALDEQQVLILIDGYVAYRYATCVVLRTGDRSFDLFMTPKPDEPTDSEVWEFAQSKGAYHTGPWPFKDGRQYPVYRAWLIETKQRKNA